MVIKGSAEPSSERLLLMLPYVDVSSNLLLLPILMEAKGMIVGDATIRHKTHAVIITIAPNSPFPVLLSPSVGKPRDEISSSVSFYYSITLTRPLPLGATSMFLVVPRSRSSVEDKCGGGGNWSKCREMWGREIVYFFCRVAVDGWRRNSTPPDGKLHNSMSFVV